ncbi:MAG: hypothetical protein ABS935_18270 [Solibacillus sp.]|uniref:hypothetical protein n=1 Tax=Solibacillus sp. TaxID=1909654 RepID=UPI0033155C5A
MANIIEVQNLQMKFGKEAIKILAPQLTQTNGQANMLRGLVMSPASNSSCYHIDYIIQETYNRFGNRNSCAVS